MPTSPTSDRQGDQDLRRAHGGHPPTRQADGPGPWVRGRRVGRCGGQRSASGGRGGRGVAELVGLVDHVGGDLPELVAVLAGVVGAEQQLAAGLELDAR